MRKLIATIFSLALIACALLALAWFIDWGVLKATWIGTSKASCTADGACWAMIHARFKQFIFGFYPETQYWRVYTAFALLIMSSLQLRYAPWSIRIRLSVLGLCFAMMLYLLYGGGLLPVVPTERWGGLMLTVFLTFGCVVASFPIALLLALGRSSNLIVIKSVCVLFIEFVRGVPLISILFFASVMLPLFFTQEITINKLLRAYIAITLFQAAYLAEVIRGGLQSLDKGQYQAAQSLGFNYWQTQCLIVLPQALTKVIPGIVNNYISLFKDTTLILIIGIYDFLGIVQAATTSPQWLGTSLEAYLFCALVYWTLCFTFSKWSQQLEHQLSRSR